MGTTGIKLATFFDWTTGFGAHIPPTEIIWCHILIMDHCLKFIPTTFPRFHSGYGDAFLTFAAPRVPATRTMARGGF